MNNALAIRDLQIHSLDVPLAAPYTTSSSALEVLSNVALCIELLSAWLSGHLPLQALSFLHIFSGCSEAGTLMVGTDQITKLIGTAGGAMFVVTDTGEWAEENFGGCEFGDKRRGARLVRVARDVARHVGDSLLACCGGDEAAAEGMYRLLRNGRVEPSAIAEGGFLATARRACSCDVLLAVEDTTMLSYRHSVVEELGDISNTPVARSRGFIVHSVLLVEGATGHTVGEAPG